MCLRIFRTRQAKERERQELERERMQNQIDTLGATVAGLELSLEFIKNAIEENRCIIQDLHHEIQNNREMIQQHLEIDMDTTDGDDTKWNSY
jgi:two-component sensor histidine kinase